jgi:deoxycytidine triphosphate deaminase
MAIDFSTFASDNDDAARRAAMFAHQDPLPSVPCSLLSSAEIHDYMRLTGMLHEYYPGALKSASYEAHIAGRFIWWDEHYRKHDEEIGRGDPCVLPANSITFVQVEPIFRLPDYIAVRFNLRITHVHRGLLLGTGPLVDPGFEGKLLIPLHNLTSSEYDLDTSEALIWIEFTKTTYGRIPTEADADTQRNFVPFPPSKKNLSPDYYLRKANAGRPIQSSIPIAIAEGRRDAASASRSAQQARGVVLGVGLAALAALIVALTALYFQIGGMIQSSLGLTSSVEQTLAPLTADERATAEKVGSMQKQIDQLRQQVQRVEDGLAAITRSPTAPRARSRPGR